VIPDIFKESLLLLSFQLGIICRTADHNFCELFLMIFRYEHCRNWFIAGVAVVCFVTILNPHVVASVLRYQDKGAVGGGAPARFDSEAPPYVQFLLLWFGWWMRLAGTGVVI
jgi:hypothetical protein